MNIDKQRELFEKWYGDTFEEYEGGPFFTRCAFPKSRYADSEVQERWGTWLASATANEVGV